MKRLIWVFAAMSINGCACLFGLPPDYNFNFDAGQFIAPHFADGGPLEVQHPDCSASPETVGAAVLFNTPRGAPVANGIVETPLSATGCLVIREEYAGGRRTRLSVHQYLGYVVPLDVSAQVYTEAEVVFVDAVLAADGSMLATFDTDGNLKRDAVIEEVRSGGLLQRRTATQFDDSNDSVMRRETMTIFDVDHMHFKVEMLVAGVLTAVSDFDAPTAQHQVTSCYQPRDVNAATDAVACGKTDAELRAIVHTAMKSYSSCLDGYGGGWSLSQLEAFLLDDIKVDEMNISCFRDPQYFGEAQSATDTLRLNVDMLANNCESSSFVNSTIVHEMLHFTRGPHEFDFQTITGPFGPRASAYSDPMRACEELCYGTIKTRCSCARCLGVKACDSRCSGLPSCRVDPPDGGAPTMSEAVGSYCAGTHTWYSTMASCGGAGACPGGKSSCKSYSVSCNPSCQ